MTVTDSSINSIRTRGFRLTRQRKLVLEIVQASEEHLDAETIFVMAKEKDPNISLPTVYRSLAMLKQVNLLSEHHLGEDHSHFEPVTITPHYHFTCTHCKQVIEFEAKPVLNIVHSISKKFGLRVNEVHLHLSGYCADCLKLLQKDHE